MGKFYTGNLLGNVFCGTLAIGLSRLRLACVQEAGASTLSWSAVAPVSTSVVVC